MVMVVSFPAGPRVVSGFYESAMYWCDWQSDSGLPDNTVVDVACGDGFLWVRRRGLAWLVSMESGFRKSRRSRRRGAPQRFCMRCVWTGATGSGWRRIAGTVCVDRGDHRPGLPRMVCPCFPHTHDGRWRIARVASGFPTWTVVASFASQESGCNVSTHKTVLPGAHSPVGE